MSITKSKGIIFAADIDKKERLSRTIRDVQPYIEAVKVGNIALYEFGWGIIGEMRALTDKPIIADFKLMDVPFVAEKLAARALQEGADGIIVCGPVGPETLSVCRDIYGGKSVFVFTQFTDPMGLISDDLADEYIELALVLKCSGIQVPATYPDRISQVKKRVGERLTIISCGLERQGPDIGSAIAAGADYEIIGRAIYDPREPGVTPGEAAMSARGKISDALRVPQPNEQRRYRA